MSLGRRVVPVVGLILMVGGCTTSPPDKLDNICDIFREKDGWYADAKDARERWGAPISIMMAFMHQESRFVAGAKPPRTKIWGIIPGPRASDAYGYSQARMTLGTGTSVNRETTARIAISSKTPLISSVGITTPRIRSTGLPKTMRLDCTSTITRGTVATNEERIAQNHG